MDLTRYNERVEEAGEYPDFTPLPPGEYMSIIVDTMEKETKDGTGAYLQLEFEVTEGKYEGRKFWERLNLKNKNPKAEEIAFRQLKSLYRALGLMNPTDSAELHNIELLVKLKIEEGSGQYGPSNRVVSYTRKNQKRKVKETREETTDAPPWA